MRSFHHVCSSIYRNASSCWNTACNKTALELSMQFVQRVLHMYVCPEFWLPTTRTVALSQLSLFLRTYFLTVSFYTGQKRQVTCMSTISPLRPSLNSNYTFSRISCCITLSCWRILPATPLTTSSDRHCTYSVLQGLFCVICHLECSLTIVTAPLCRRTYSDGTVCEAGVSTWELIFPEPPHI